MKITQLEVHNIAGCKYVNLKFNNASPVFIIRSLNPPKCDVVPLAIQLICSSKYNQLEKLHYIRELVKFGIVTMIFTLPCTNKEAPASDDATDEPCTSRQAHERAQKRLDDERKRRMSPIVIKACRNFTVDPQSIEYSINNGPQVSCAIDVFHVRFFTCTDIILPGLSDLTNGKNCNGRWLDLLRTDFIYKRMGENHLISKFCELYSRRKVNLKHQLSHLTTTTLIGRNYLNQGRISKLIYIFQDIRCVFEYITCLEYTVWFLLPTTFGNLQDITEITTTNVNFDLMKTKLQLKTSTSSAGNTSTSSAKFLWTEAHGYVQELFLVAVQIVFGYHCGQNIIFLRSLEKLNEHQSFEHIRTAFARRAGSQGQWVEKNYLQRIVNICVKFDLACVLEYQGGIPFEPKNAFIITCEKEYRSKHWKISLKNLVEGVEININDANILLQAAKRRFEERHVKFHPRTKY